jgi:hypothetical protein
MKFMRWMLIVLGLSSALIANFFVYTIVQLNIARSKGVYATAEKAMLARLEKNYSADRDIKILSARPNEFDGSQPHVWYVIAEVHAFSRADGSELGHNGCDAPGSYFVHTDEGWVYMPEMVFPDFVGFGMKVFGLAGEGQSTPSTDLLPNYTYRFCNGEGGVWYGK